MADLKVLADQKPKQPPFPTMLPGNGIPFSASPSPTNPLTVTVSNMSVPWPASKSSRLPQPPSLSQPMGWRISSNNVALSNPAPRMALDKMPPTNQLIGHHSFVYPTNVDAAILKANSIAPNDSIGALLLGQIQDVKLRLQSQGLASEPRKFLESNLAELQARLEEHKNQVKDRGALVAKLRANPRSALTDFTNRQDPVVQSMSELKLHYERALAHTNLAPAVRKADEHLLATIDQHLADHQTNVQLWANLHQAQASKDPERQAEAKRKLASYLATRLGKVQGKTYPADISLVAIMAEYKKLEGGASWFRSRSAIRAAIFAVVLTPPIAMALMALMTMRKRVANR